VPPLGAGRLGLVAFDLRHGLPLVWREARARLGAWRALGVLWRLGRPSAALGALGPPESAAEAFTRHQLGGRLRLEAAFAPALGLEPARAAAAELAVAVGARFLASRLSLPTRARWAGWSEERRRVFVAGALARFQNAEVGAIEVGPDGLAFDVRRCHFVSLCAALGRPDLLEAFCDADARFFGDPASPVALRRPETLATGGDRCAFRLGYKAPKA